MNAPIFKILLLGFAIQAFAADAVPAKTVATATALRETALKSELGYQIVESLTTEVGPRLAGSAGDHAGVAWAQAKLKELNFDKVWIEEANFPFWIRGETELRVLSPYPQTLAVVALGHSVGTPDEGIEAEVVEVASYEALLTMDAAAVKGKIVFINNRMERHQDGHGYGKAVIARGKGAVAGAKLGALAVIIRSIGTDSHRFPHTGGTNYEEGVTQIPIAAISGPDANQLEQIGRRGKPIRLFFKQSSRSGGIGSSHNVIGEIRGREKPEEIVLIGAHLDSWDLGTGAIDDGAGVGIVVAAAKLIAQLPERPRRTIRVVLFANEEGGLFGAETYAKAHAAEIGNHIIGSESDFGAGKIYSLASKVGPEADGFMAELAKLLSPLGVVPTQDEAHPGPDLIPLAPLGMPFVSLEQDGTDYFDYHHTPDDTLDKIDPAQLAQNVATYAVFAYLSAETTVQFRAK